ncbi:uncharacterized protein LOC144555649 [Carex rostrata]
MPITTRSSTTSDETTMDLATLLEAQRQQLNACTQSASNNSHDIAKLELTVDKKLDDMNQAISHQFRDLMTAIQANRSSIPAYDTRGGNQMNSHSVVQPGGSANLRGDENIIQDAIFEQDPPRREEIRQERRQIEQTPTKFNLPRVDFPTFAGIKPNSWVDCCNFYFDMYQVPEEYKSRMAVMHFTGPADDWYRSFKISNPQPPWPILVEEVLNYFAHNTEGFISGLKDELRHTIELFGPSTINEAIRFARQIELSIDSTVKKGHKCHVKALNTIEEDEKGNNDLIPTEQHEEQFTGEFDDFIEYEEREQAVVNLCNGEYNSSMTFKGKIGTIPICALMDSGSTHSFIHPNIVHNLNLEITKSNPLTVRVANGHKMQTDEVCKNLKFSLQNNEFNTDLRVLDVQGHDLLLGMNWLTKLGLTLVDWNKGTMKLKKDGKFIKLEDEDVEAKLKLLTIIEYGQGILNQKHEEGQVLMAQILNMEEKVEQQVHPSLVPVLSEFSELFIEPNVLPPKRDIDHRIPLKPDSKPVNLRPYRFSHYQKLEIDKIVEELLKNSFIQPSCSPYSSPILLVKKKDNSWRMCVDYRKLNENTVKNKYPIPIIDDLLDELKHASVFTKLDLRSGYHQIRMNEEDIYKTAFHIHDGLYEFRVMPLGLTNAPASFQALMNSIFKPYLRKFILVFFYDILIYSATLEEHVNHVRIAFELLRHHQLFLKRSKCDIAVEQIEYLGHIISKDGVSTDPKKIEAMSEWQVPKNVKSLRGFLGLTGYYRKFIQGYGVIAKPLTDLLKKDAFKWNNEAQKAFESLKIAMTQAPILTLPDFSQPFVVEKDASNIGIGAVLLQNKRPIAYLSKQLGPKNQLLSTYEKGVPCFTHSHH